jgi:hypothetical protein
MKKHNTDDYFVAPKDGLYVVSNKKEMEFKQGDMVYSILYGLCIYEGTDNIRDLSRKLGYDCILTPLISPDRKLTGRLSSIRVATDEDIVDNLARDLYYFDLGKDITVVAYEDENYVHLYGKNDEQITLELEALRKLKTFLNKEVNL